MSGISLLLLHQFIVFYRFSRYVDTIVYDLPDGRVARLRVFGYFPNERALNGGLSWLMKHAQPNDIVATYAPQWAYLRTGLKAVMPPFELNPERAQKLLDSVPVTYLIFEDNFTKRYVSLVTQSYPNIWREIYSDQHGSFKIYERASPTHHRANIVVRHGGILFSVAVALAWWDPPRRQDDQAHSGRIAWPSSTSVSPLLPRQKRE